MATADWDKLAAGQGCAFDVPRADNTTSWDKVATLAASTLYLPHNQMYRGHCVLVFDPRHATRLDQLSAAEWSSYAADLHSAVKAVVGVCRPDHVNVESLGNVMPHLHWHVIPRYKRDPKWGSPIWAAEGQAQPERRLTSDDRTALIDALRSALR